MFQHIIYTIYNEPSDYKFVPEKPYKSGSENNREEYQPGKFVRNRWDDIIDAENDVPDDPHRDSERTDDDQSLDKGP